MALNPHLEGLRQLPAREDFYSVRHTSRAKGKREPPSPIREPISCLLKEPPERSWTTDIISLQVWRRVAPSASDVRQHLVAVPPSNDAQQPIGLRLGVLRRSGFSSEARHPRRQETRMDSDLRSVQGAVTSASSTAAPREHLTGRRPSKRRECPGVGVHGAGLGPVSRSHCHLVFNNLQTRCEFTKTRILVNSTPLKHLESNT